MTRTIILSSGISDLATAMAALAVDGELDTRPPHEIVAAIVGHRIALPDNLISAFLQAAASAFNLSRIQAFRWTEDETLIDTFAASEADVDVLASNQLQDERQRNLITSLKPKKFIFYDNGLSSYAPHDIDLNAWAKSIPACRSFSACLSYAEEFGVPPYLAAFAVKKLTPAAQARSIACIRRTCVSDRELLPPGAIVILGTSFDRTNIISSEEEQLIHKRLIEIVRKQQPGPYFFKPHPRATQSYLTSEDGVTTLPTELPIEVYASDIGGTAYSFSSTALFSLREMYGWRSHRVEHPIIERVFSKRPQLAKIRVMEPSFVLDAL